MPEIKTYRANCWPEGIITISIDAKTPEEAAQWIKTNTILRRDSLDTLLSWLQYWNGEKWEWVLEEEG